jgi:hypothetical protein
MFELGTGESPLKKYPNYNAYVRALFDVLSGYERKIAYLCFPTGCLIQHTHNQNRVDTMLCEAMTVHGYPLKGHNSDYASNETLRTLSNYVDALNVAPQLGVLMTRAYQDYAQLYGYDISDWETAVVLGDRWKRWGPVQHAIALGGQYHFNTLPERFRENAYLFVRNRVKKLVLWYVNQFRKEKVQ